MVSSAGIWHQFGYAAFDVASGALQSPARWTRRREFSLDQHR